MPDTPVERAAREITALVQQGRRRWMEVTPLLIAETLERKQLLAAPVDGELRDVLVDVLTDEDDPPATAVYSDGTIKIVAEPLIDAIMPAITAHVVDQEQALREEIVRDIKDLTAHARDERPSRAFIDGFERAVALAAHVARGEP